MSVLRTRGGKPVLFNLSPDELEQIRRLWEGMPELSSKQIGMMFGVTKNCVIGHAHRRGWKMRKQATKQPATLSQRLDALNIFPPPSTCVYPIGDPGKEGFRFCAERVTQQDTSYCETHHRLVHVGEASLRKIAEWEADPDRKAKQAARGRMQWESAA